MSRDARATRRARNLDASLDADAATPRAFDERASDRRDAYLDNLKYALMLIVVWNHALQEFLRALDAHERRGWCERDAVNATTHGHVRTFYLVLCATGMPLFAGASGYLSKSWLRAAREDEASAVNLLVRVRGAFGTLLGTYAVWQAFYVAINYYDVAPLQWWAPVGVMWYLLALFFWRMSVLVVGGLRNGVIVALSVFMGLFVGFTETATTKNGNAAFDWQRVFVYSVYFFLGCVALKPEHLQRLQSIDYGRRATFGAIVLAWRTRFSTSCSTSSKSASTTCSGSSGPSRRTSRPPWPRSSSTCSNASRFTSSPHSPAWASWRSCRVRSLSSPPWVRERSTAISRTSCSFAGSACSSIECGPPPHCRSASPRARSGSL